MNRLKITLIIVFLPCILFAQNYLSEEKEIEIKLSGKYYWDECVDSDASTAKQCAFEKLKTLVIQESVSQSKKQEEVLKAIDIGVHFDHLQRQGQVEILAWIDKDSVFITTQKPITKMLNPQPATTPVQTVTKPAPAPVFTTETELNPVAEDNLVLKELAACKNFKEVRRVIAKNGFVFDDIEEGSKHFSNPEKCIIAVFTADGTLSALLDVGSSSRIDLLSGQTVQNPEQHYNRNEYYLWYMQQKK